MKKILIGINQYSQDGRMCLIICQPIACDFEEAARYVRKKARLLPSTTPVLKWLCSYFLSIQLFLTSKIGKIILSSSGYCMEFSNKCEIPAKCLAAVLCSTSIYHFQHLHPHFTTGKVQLKTAWTTFPAQTHSFPHSFPHIVSSNDKSVSSSLHL